MRRGEQVSPANFTPATPAQHVLARFIDLTLIAAALFTAMIAGFLSLPSGWLLGPVEPPDIGPECLPDRRDRDSGRGSDV